MNHFHNSPSFKKMQGFKTKVCVILDYLSFCNMLFSQKLKLTAEKQYMIRTECAEILLLLQKKLTHRQVFVNSTTK